MSFEQTVNPAFEGFWGLLHLVITNLQDDKQGEDRICSPQWPWACFERVYSIAE